VAGTVPWTFTWESIYSYQALLFVPSCAYFTVEETETQRDNVAYPNSHSKQVVEQASKPGNLPPETGL
jgi:hypothetical protein